MSRIARETSRDLKAKRERRLARQMRRYIKVREELTAQREKFNEACPRPGVSNIPTIALAQIDRKMRRLEDELEDAWVDLEPAQQEKLQQEASS